MATKTKETETDKPVTGGEARANEDSGDWTSDDVPRVSMGEGKDKKGVPRVDKITAVYLYSIRQRIKRRMTTLHRMAGADRQEFLLYGSGAINGKLLLLPTGTKVRLTYLGEVDTGQDTPMKNIRVEWPRGTKLLDKAPAPVEREPGSDDGDDDVAF